MFILYSDNTETYVYDKTTKKNKMSCDRRKNFIQRYIESQFVTDVVKMYTSVVKIFEHIIKLH